MLLRSAGLRRGILWSRGFEGRDIWNSAVVGSKLEFVVFSRVFVRDSVRI